MKCVYTGVSVPEISRVAYADYRRWLPADHPFRTDRKFGADELRPAPPRRTNDSTRQFVAAVQAARAAGVAHGNVGDPSKSTGVLGQSALARLAYYDLIRGLTVDPMHVMKDVVLHLMQLMKGERVPKAPRGLKDKGKNPAKESKDSKGLLGDWQAAVKQHDAWLVDKATQATCDRKYSGLKCPSGFLDRTVTPFGNTGPLHSLSKC